MNANDSMAMAAAITAITAIMTPREWRLSHVSFGFFFLVVFFAEVAMVSAQFVE